MDDVRIEGAELVGSGKRIPVGSIAGAKVVLVEPDNSGPQLLLMAAIILFGVGVHAVFHQRDAAWSLISAGISFAMGIGWAHRIRAFYALEVQLPGERVRIGHAADEVALERLAALLAPAPSPTPTRIRASA